MRPEHRVVLVILRIVNNEVQDLFLPFVCVLQSTGFNVAFTLLVVLLSYILGRVYLTYNSTVLDFSIAYKFIIYKWHLSNFVVNATFERWTCFNSHCVMWTTLIYFTKLRAYHLFPVVLSFVLYQISFIALLNTMVLFESKSFNRSALH